MKNKTLSKRVQTRISGVFYKEIISDSNKVVDKVYGIRYIDEDGIERLKTIGKYSEGIREQYCKKKRDEIVTKIRLGEELPHIARERSPLTFNDIAELYFKDKYLAKDIEKERKRYENHIKPSLGTKRLENISIDHIDDMQREYMKDFAPRTVNHLVFMIATIFKHAIKKQVYRGINPASAINGLKVDNARERFLTLDEINKLLQMAELSHQDVWLFVKLSLSTGGRVGTIMSITKKDVKLSNNSVTLMDHKNTKSYTGFYNDELKAILSKRIESLKANDSVLKLHRATIESKLRGILDALFNLEIDRYDRKNRVVIHTLRHTFASHLAMNGISILTIQKLMNHSSIEMTMRYSHLAPDQGLNAVKELYQ